MRENPYESPSYPDGSQRVRADQSVAARCVRILAGLLIVLCLAGEALFVSLATRFLSDPILFVKVWRGQSLGQQLSILGFFVLVNALLVGAVGLFRLKRWGRSAVIGILVVVLAWGAVEVVIEANYAGASLLLLPMAMVAFLWFGTNSVFADDAR